jgi:hypothetical protein
LNENAKYEARSECGEFHVALNAACFAAQPQLEGEAAAELARDRQSGHQWVIHLRHWLCPAELRRQENDESVFYTQRKIFLQKYG